MSWCYSNSSGSRFRLRRLEEEAPSQFQQPRLLGWIWDCKRRSRSVFFTGGPAGTAHHKDSCVVVFVEIAADLEGQFEVIAHAPGGATCFAPDGQLPHIPSVDERSAGVQEIFAEAPGAKWAAKRAAPSGPSVRVRSGFRPPCSRTWKDLLAGWPTSKSVGLRRVRCSRGPALLGMSSTLRKSEPPELDKARTLLRAGAGVSRNRQWCTLAGGGVRCGRRNDVDRGKVRQDPQRQRIRSRAPASAEPCTGATHSAHASRVVATITAAREKRVREHLMILTGESGCWQRHVKEHCRGSLQRGQDLWVRSPTRVIESTGKNGSHGLTWWPVLRLSDADVRPDVHWSPPDIKKRPGLETTKKTVDDDSGKRNAKGQIRMSWCRSRFVPP